MKKIYFKPSTEVTSISTVQFIAGSLDPNSGTGSVTEEQVTDGTPGESRRFSIWDDEEY